MLALTTTLLVLAQVPAGKGTQPGELDGGALILGAVSRCKSCHDKDISFEPAIYLPFDGWVSSMMGNAMRDPLFKAALTVANQDVPGIGSWCLRCHSPSGWVQGHTTPPDGSALDEIDKEGITCDACHRSKVPSNEPGAPYLNNAQLYWEYTPVKYGPYANVSSPAHDGAPSAFTGSSELCGQCHQVQNPIGPWRSADGGIIGPNFPLDTTYEEWKQSAFARSPLDAGFASCADCHMPRFDPDGGVFNVGKTGPYRPAPRRHVFVGGNLWGLKAVQAANPELAQYADQFAETESWVLKNLANAAALKVTLPTDPVSGDTVKARVQVTNLTGHKLPSGYADGRRVVVQLRVDGKVVRGGFDGGELLDAANARVYEILHGRAGVGVEEHLALHDMVVKDSRLPPRGLIATPATAPVGVGWFDLADGGLSHVDDFEVTLPLPPSAADGAQVKVEAVLLFQSTTPEYVHFLRDQNTTDDAGQTLFDIWKATGEAAPVEMTRAEGTLTVSRPQTTGGGAGGNGGNGGGAGGGNVTGPCGCSSASGLFGALGLLLLWRGRRRSWSSV